MTAAIQDRGGKRSGRLNSNLLFRLLRLRALGKGYRENALFEARLDLVGIYPSGTWKLRWKEP
jgi:hypothetical protein